MGKYIEKSDLENKELKNLPIRRGCNNVLGVVVWGYVKTLKDILTEKNMKIL